MKEPVSLADRIQSIERKVRSLAANMLQQRQTIVDLQVENKRLKSLLQQADSPSALMQENQTTLEMTQSNMSESQIQQLRKELDLYIEELDKCIDWLQNRPQ